MALTEQQIKNWRFVLLGTLGPWANIMPAADIERIAENMQRRVDREEEVRHGRDHERRTAEREARERREKAEMAVHEAREKAREDRLASLSQRIADALEE